MTINNNRLTSAFHHLGFQRYRSEIQQKQKYTHQSHTRTQMLLNTPHLPRHVCQINLCEEMSLGWIHLYWMREQLPYVGPAGNLRAVSLFPPRRQSMLPRPRHGGIKWSRDRGGALSAGTAESTHPQTHRAEQRFISLMWPAYPYVTWCYDSFLSSCLRGCGASEVNRSVDDVALNLIQRSAAQCSRRAAATGMWEKKK